MRCSRCGVFGHSSPRCHTNLFAPVETPGHNGVYRGALAPRLVPAGVYGSDLGGESIAAQKARKGHLVQSAQQTRARRSGTTKIAQRNLDGRKPA